jgi:hypothetical protein
MIGRRIRAPLSRQEVGHVNGTIYSQPHRWTDPQIGDFGGTNQAAASVPMPSGRGWPPSTATWVRRESR